MHPGLPPHAPASSSPRRWLTGWRMAALGGLSLGAAAALWWSPATASNDESNRTATSAKRLPNPSLPPAATYPPATQPTPPRDCTPTLEHFTVDGCVITVIAFPAAAAWPGHIVHAADRAAFIQQPQYVLINGGYFEPGGRPTGLVLAGSRQDGALSHAGLLSGFVWADSSDHLHIALQKEPPPAPVRWAIQSGPVLVEPGGNLGIHSTGRAASRTVLALRHDRLWIVTTGPIELKTLAQALLAHGVDTAINLDGGPSTTLDARLPATTHHSPTTLHRAGDPAVPYFLGFAP